MCTLLSLVTIVWACHSAQGQSEERWEEFGLAFSISVKSSSSFVPSAPPTFSLTFCKTNTTKNNMLGGRAESVGNSSTKMRKNKSVLLSSLLISQKYVKYDIANWKYAVYFVIRTVHSEFVLWCSGTCSAHKHNLPVTIVIMIFGSRITGSCNPHQTTLLLADNTQCQRTPRQC